MRLPPFVSETPPPCLALPHRYAARAAAGAGRASAAARGAPHAAYGALDGVCVSSDSSEYVYKLCLFSSMEQTQRPGVGRGGFSLGRRWEWLPRTADDAAAVVGRLSGGDRCAGPGVDRSIDVRFVCAAAGESLGRVTEASTCKYEVTLETPAAC